MKKGDKLYVEWKGYYNSFNSRIYKKDIILISGYFPEPKYLGGSMKFKLDLSNYATKADLKNATGVDTANLVDTVDLANLKPDIG